MNSLFLESFHTLATIFLERNLVKYISLCVRWVKSEGGNWKGIEQRRSYIGEHFILEIKPFPSSPYSLLLTH